MSLGRLSVSLKVGVKPFSKGFGLDAERILRASITLRKAAAKISAAAVGLGGGQVFLAKQAPGVRPIAR